MQTQSVNSTYVLPPAPKARNDYLDQAAFLQLLTVQLSTQNPLEPMSDRDFFAQLAQLGTVQGVDELKRSMQMTQASAMLGKNVVVSSPMSENGVGNTTITGRVEAVEMSNQKVYVRVEGVKYEMSRIMQILP
jgi:flagellar basal-body rod modification protein FlgD